MGVLITLTSHAARYPAVLDFCASAFQNPYEVVEFPQHVAELFPLWEKISEFVHSGGRNMMSFDSGERWTLPGLRKKVHLIARKKVPAKQSNEDSNEVIDIYLLEIEEDMKSGFGNYKSHISHYFIGKAFDTLGRGPEKLFFAAAMGISCVGSFGSNSYMYKVNGTANINAIRAAADQDNSHISRYFIGKALDTLGRGPEKLFFAAAMGVLITQTSHAAQYPAILDMCASAFEDPSGGAKKQVQNLKVKNLKLQKILVKNLKLLQFLLEEAAD